MNWREQFQICLVTAVGLTCLLNFLSWPWLLPALIIAVVTLLGLPLGAIALLLCHRLCGGEWGRLAQPCWQGLLAFVPGLAVAILCLLPWMSQLYPALDGQILGASSPFKSTYLQSDFFFARIVFYLGVWVALAALLQSSRGWPTSIYALGLVLWLWSLGFFAIDWYLSVTPEFYSDIFGLLLASFYTSGAALFALLSKLMRPTSPAGDDLVRLSAALLVTWAFLSCFQWILIWSTNLPAEIEWYLARGEGIWPLIAGLWLFLFFVAPMGLVLSGQWRAPWVVCTAQILALFGYLLQGAWLLLPGYGPDSGMALVMALIFMAVALVVMYLMACRWQRIYG